MVTIVSQFAADMRLRPVADLMKGVTTLCADRALHKVSCTLLIWGKVILPLSGVRLFKKERIVKFQKQLHFFVFLLNGSRPDRDEKEIFWMRGGKDQQKKFREL